MFRISVMCRTLKVSRSGFYAWLEARAHRDPARERLKNEIRRIHAESRYLYGYRRIQAELEEQGFCASEHAVRSVMRELGISGVQRGRKRCTTKRSETAEQKSEDLVQRNFAAARANQLWVADATYIPTAEGTLYLAVVQDAFSRRIVGWETAKRQCAELMTSAVDHAAAGRDVRGVIHHSDHGSQYTSIAFGKRCEELGILPSLGSVGDCYDNAMAESWFGTLEAELLQERKFETRSEAVRELSDYIDGFYNPKRLHSGLGYVSPIRFELLASRTLAA